MPAIIDIQDLTKKFGDRTAVDGLSLSVQEGDIFGFVGPNGAGKTSTIRMIATLLQPTSGEIRVAGSSVKTAPRQVRRLIGYMPDFFGVYTDMKVWEYLDFFGACYRIPEASRRALIDDLLELVDLSHRREDMVDRLSRGMKQRLSLARTLVHDPQVLILDEPASGLDPRARVEIRELLIELARMGKTIFFSTHILADVAEVCTRVGIIEAGKLVAAGTLAELHLQVSPARQVEIGVLERPEEAQRLLQSLPGVSSAELLESASTNGQGPFAGHRIALEFSGEDRALSAILSTLVRQGIPVIHFAEDHHDLEEVFLRITKGLVT
jgi:ABC-2 type transport system ATP-binding protein